MLFESLTKSKYNVFTINNKIPLGMNSYKGISKEPIISLPYNKYSGAWGIIGESGSGKSVLMKRVYAYMLGFYQKKYKRYRPGVVFDMQSEDHHLSKFANSQPHNLFYNQGEKPIGFENLECYSPVFIIDEAHYFDKPFGISVDQFDTRDFLSIGMGEGASKLLQSLIKYNEDSIKDFDQFYEALLELPINKTEFNRLPDSYIFNLNNHVNYNSKLSLISAFTHAYNDKVFLPVKDKRLKNSFISDMKKRKIIVINFHQEERYYSLYAGKILKDIYRARRDAKRKEDLGEKSTFPPPVIIIEEVDKLVPSDEKKSNYGSAHWLIEILKRARKYDILTLIATQEASSMSEKVRDHTRNWIIGKLVAKDYPYFSKFLSEEIMNVIRSLDKKNYEYCVVYSNNTFDTCYAWNSPLEINRESKMGG